MNGRKGDRWRQETDRTISLAEIISNEELFTFTSRRCSIYLSPMSQDFRGMGWSEDPAYICYWQKYPVHLQQTSVFHTDWLGGALQIWLWYENLMKWLVSFPSSHTFFLPCQVSSGCRMFPGAFMYLKENTSTGQCETDSPRNAVLAGIAPFRIPFISA